MARGSVGGADVLLLKPQTYVNRSGAALVGIRDAEGFVPARDLLVLVDEVALPLGRFRLRARGSAGGHNGLRSIEGALRSAEYPRLRIGVGPAPEGEDLAEFVLEAFRPEERAALDALLDPMAAAVECWTAEGIDAAMNKHNRRGDGP